MSETITIYCKNNNTYKDVPIGSSLLDIYTAVGAPLRYRPMNAQVNNKTESLNFRCWQPKDIEFIDYTQLSGLRTYVRSLCHIFSKAVYDIWPTATLNLEHPVSKGYYCVIHNGKNIDLETIEKIKKRMWELIDADLPFLHKSVRTVDAAVLFRERGMNDKARLIETAGLPYTSYYELEGYINFFYGCLTPSTGYIQLFDLEPYMDGVLLRIPKQTDPMELQPVIKQDKMFEAYKEHLTLQRTVGLDNVGDLNLAIEKGRSQDIILVSEAMQEKQVAKIAEKIAEQRNCGALITGESLAQVASQTMAALACTDAAQDLPVLRPCIGMDKTEIIAISRKIGTFETSIEPYEDCCTIFTPPHPKTNPTMEEILAAEAGMPDLLALEAEAAENVEKIYIRMGGEEDELL